MKSSTQDNAEGEWHKVKGKIKQVAGKTVGKPSDFINYSRESGDRSATVYLRCSSPSKSTTCSKRNHESDTTAA